MPPGLAVQVHSRGASCAGNHHCGGLSGIRDLARETAAGLIAGPEAPSADRPLPPGRAEPACGI
jgi:hypothetical protein